MAWEQVDEDGLGDANQTSIDAMKVFKRRLYVSASSESAGKLFKFTAAHKWIESRRVVNFEKEEVNLPIPRDTQVKKLGPIIATTDTSGYEWMYIAAVTSEDKSILYRTKDGIGWHYFAFPDLIKAMCKWNGSIVLGLQAHEILMVHTPTGSNKVIPMFGSSIIRNYNLENVSITSLCVANGKLYAGTWGNRRRLHGAEIWREDGGDVWRREHRFSDPNNWGVICLKNFNENLYAGTVNHTTAEIWRQEPSSQVGPTFWRKVGPTWDEGEDIQTFPFPPARYNAMHVFNGKLYVGGGAWPSYLAKSDNGTNWEEVDERGFGNKSNYTINAFETYPSGYGTNCLIVGTRKSAGEGGGELWKTCIQRTYR